MDITIPDLTETHTPPKVDLLARKIQLDARIGNATTSNPLACHVPGCNKLGKPFANPHALKMHHEAKHTGQAATLPTPVAAKKLTCKQCGAPFDLKTELMHHTRKMHPKPRGTTGGSVVKNFNCDQCGKGFKNQHAVSVHKARKHKPSASGLRKFKCNLCDRRFEGETNRQCASHITYAHKVSAIGNWTELYPKDGEQFGHITIETPPHRQARTPVIAHQPPAVKDSGISASTKLALVDLWLNDSGNRESDLRKAFELGLAEGRK